LPLARDLPAGAQPRFRRPHPTNGAKSKFVLLKRGKEQIRFAQARQRANSNWLGVVCFCNFIDR
jgi:hypothetical protein